jgi:HEAT repeat protein
MLNVLAAIGGTNALKAVRVAVGSTLPEVRAAAIRALGAWTSLDAAPDLLKLAGSSSDPTEKMLSLRSYMNLVTESDLKPAERLDLCRQAQSLAQQPDEKKLLLSVLGGINSPQALELVRPHLGDAAVAEEAQNAVLRIADKALQAKDPEPGSDLVLPCLEQTAKDASNPALKSRAEDLLTKARAKAEKK